MKTKILLAFCCLFAISSFSQDSVFHLKDYKYRTAGYKALQFSISLDAGLINRKVLSDTSTEKSFGLPLPWIGFQRILSTDNRLTTSALSLLSYYSFSSKKSNSTTAKNSGGFTDFNWQYHDRFFKKKNWFLQLGNRLHNEDSPNKQSQSSITDKNNRILVTDELVIGFGKGRIEKVQDAQMALFILNDLMREGLIEQPNGKRINDFAQLITNLNNRRIFDSRKKRIYELTLIDSFLRENKITKSTDIKQFAIINDNWAFDYNQPRSSGSDWFVHLVPSVFFEKFSTIQESVNIKSSIKTITTAIGIGPEVGYENYKPISLKWQRDMRATLSWSFHKDRNSFKNTVGGVITNDKFSSYDNNGQLYFMYGLGYFPNNRTWLNSSFDLKTIIAHGGFSINPAINFSTDYFVSYRTRLIANFSTNYLYDHVNYIAAPTEKRHTLTMNFSIGISHAFL